MQKFRIPLSAFALAVSAIAAFGTGSAYAAGQKESTTLAGQPPGQGLGRGGGKGLGRAAAPGGLYATGGQGAAPQAYRAAESAALAALPRGAALQAREIAELISLYEEEKLARDVYATLGERFGLPVFNNLALSEHSHMDLVAALLGRYAVSVPADRGPGAFQDAEKAAAYSRLVVEGLSGEAEAATVGARIERDDIQILRELVQSTANEDVRYVLDRLLAGSENHLAAFERRLRR